MRPEKTIWLFAKKCLTLQRYKNIRKQYETYMKGFAKGNEKGFFVSLPQITLKPYRYGDTEERSLL
ncbi:MAG: hypothetical protein SPL43_00495, partial [Prevotella sp.]|nr:hypothetical protein [Prevotella sp.]